MNSENPDPEATVRLKVQIKNRTRSALKTLALYSRMRQGEYIDKIVAEEFAELAAETVRRNRSRMK